MKLKVVIPMQSFELAGTDIKLQAKTPHFAVDATNQPNYKKKKLVFVFENAEAARNFLTDNGEPRAILLCGNDYSLAS